MTLREALQRLYEFDRDAVIYASRPVTLSSDARVVVGGWDHDDPPDAVDGLPLLMDVGHADEVMNGPRQRLRDGTAGTVTPEALLDRFIAYVKNDA